MHARNVLLFASVLLPVIGAPVATKENNSVQQRSVNALSQLRSYISKREPLLEGIPQALSDIVFETKRDVDAEDVQATEDVLDGDDDDDVEEEEDSVADVGIDTSEVDQTKRGLRGTGGSRGGKRGLRGNGGAGGHKRGLRGTGGSRGGKRGLRGNGGAGGHKRGLRGNAGAGGHKRGLRGNGGAGGHKRSLFARFFDSFLA
ncbi:hypothetical protein AA0116_g2511 [Alternaria tenuissima]|nr:hypothetical protein AA0116_g2511 [Alternaria tenuissima]